MAARRTRRSPGAIFPMETRWQMCAMVRRCTEAFWHGRIYHRRGRRRNGLAGHDDLPDHEGVRRAGVIVHPRPVKGDCCGLTTLEDTSVPAAGVRAGRIVRLAAAVGEGDLAAGLDRDAWRGEIVVNHPHSIRLLDWNAALEQAGEAERYFGWRRRRSLELGDAVIGAASQRECPDHIAVGGSGLSRKATYRDGEVLDAVDLVSDRGGVCARAGLPVPQKLSIARVVGLNLAVGFAVEQHVVAVTSAPLPWPIE
jgi:hypothetical protein